MTDACNLSPPQDDPFRRIWRLLLSAFGLLFLLIGLLLLVREVEFGRQAVRVSGSTVEVRVSDSGDGPNYTPVVEFSTQDGRKVRFEGIATSPKPIQGEPVLVLYRRIDPRDARIDSFVQRWLFPTVFTAIGTLVLIVGVMMSRRRSPRCS